jgi:hypothetical protein
MMHHNCRAEADTRVAYWPALSNPCLQVADYCCWAVQRKWERNDRRSFNLIEQFIASEIVVSSGEAEGFGEETV